MSSAPLRLALPDVLRDPATAADVAAELRRVHDESAGYWASYALEEFFRRPLPDVWAAAEHVRHLTKVVRAIARGFGMPRLLLGLRFGWSRRPSRSYTALRADYDGALARGGRAGRFAPSPIAPGAQGEPDRARIMQHHAQAVDGLRTVLARWPERALDRYRLPHPLLGKLTAREMAFFCLLHNVHHVHVAERRRREASAMPAAGTRA